MAVYYTKKFQCCRIFCVYTSNFRVTCSITSFCNVIFLSSNIFMTVYTCTVHIQILVMICLGIIILLLMQRTEIMSKIHSLCCSKVYLLYTHWLQILGRFHGNNFDMSFRLVVSGCGEKFIVSPSLFVDFIPCDRCLHWLLVGHVGFMCNRKTRDWIFFDTLRCVLFFMAKLDSWTIWNAWVRSQHYSYWCPGVKAPGLQYPQCWLNSDCLGAIIMQKYYIYSKQHWQITLHYEKNIPVIYLDEGSSRAPNWYPCSWY